MQPRLDNRIIMDKLNLNLRVGTLQNKKDQDWWSVETLGLSSHDNTSILPKKGDKAKRGDNK